MNITLEERIEGLSRIWSTAKYNFARWDELTELDWGAEYRAALPRVIAIENAAEYYAELSKFVALLRDGHSYVVAPDELSCPYAAAFSTMYMWGKHVVYSVPKGCGVPLFSEILAVNGTSLGDYLREKVYPFMWHEKEDSKFYYGQLGYEIICHEQGEIMIDTDGGSFTVVNGAGGETDEPPEMTNPVYSAAVPFARSDAGYSLRVTSDGIGVFNIWSCNDPTLRDALYSNIEKYSGCRSFIIDLRDNRGGSSRNIEPLAQLFFDCEIFAERAYSPLYIPEFAAMAQYRHPENRYDGLTDEEARLTCEIAEHKSFRAADYRFRIADCPAYLPQPVVVLSSCRTASAGESLLAMLKYQDRAVIVGERSYGSTGQPIFGELPHGGYFGICTLKCTLPDGFDYNNVGIAPHIEIENSREDRLNGYDRVFDKGLEALRELAARAVKP
jgi:hypothetical protein